MDQIPAHSVSLFVRTGVYFGYTVVRSFIHVIRMPMGCRAHRDFLRLYLPEYYRVKSVAKENPAHFAQFQSHMWTLCIRHWGIQPPNPEDAQAIEDWMKLRQRVSTPGIAQMTWTYNNISIRCSARSFGPCRIGFPSTSQISKKRRNEP